MSNLLKQLMAAGRTVADLCRTGLLFVLQPVIQLVLRAVRKGNRVAARLVFAIKRFLYIAHRYGYKRAVAHVGYRLEQRLVAVLPKVKRGVVRFAPMGLAAVVLVACISGWTAFTMAYEVRYDGANVGYVSSESVVDDACRLISNRVVDNDFSAKKVTYSLTVVSAGSVNDVNEICENIIEASDEIHPGVGLYVDGQLIVVCKDAASIETAMSQVVDNYAKTTGKEALSFANTIEYVNGLFAADAIRDTVSAEELSSVLTVMQTVKETYTQAIDFDVVEKGDATKYVGYRFTTRAGQEGEAQVVANVSYVDGKEVDREIVSQTVTKQPVSQIITVGTKQYSKANSDDDGNCMFWPVENATVSNISSYFGDGRNHKGTDILAPNGTAIFAAEDGVVTYVGWESGYGYYCVIDHGDGVSTLYSHCSSISAVTGQTVSRGDYIAAVGITGRASAYHLHFEVRINGSAVDARPYLGIN